MRGQMTGWRDALGRAGTRHRGFKITRCAVGTHATFRGAWPTRMMGTQWPRGVRACAARGDGGSSATPVGRRRGRGGQGTEGDIYAKRCDTLEINMMYRDYRRRAGYSMRGLGGAVCELVGGGGREGHGGGGARGVDGGAGVEGALEGVAGVEARDGGRWRGGVSGGVGRVVGGTHRGRTSAGRGPARRGCGAGGRGRGWTGTRRAPRCCGVSAGG